MKKLLVICAMLQFAGCGAIGLAPDTSKATVASQQHKPQPRVRMCVPFKPTGSPCMDALRLGLEHAGCKQITSAGNQASGLFVMQCSDGAKTEEMKRAFVLVRSGAPRPIGPSLKPWCMDDVLLILTGNVQVPLQRPVPVTPKVSPK